MPINTLIRWTAVAMCAAPLYACTFVESFIPRAGETTDVIDRQKKLSINDFRNLNDINKEVADADPTITASLGVPPIPDIAQVLAAPKPPKVANTKLVTLAVTDDVPLRDVLFELGRLAGVDIEVGPGLDAAGINLRATDRPFNEVIERIATLANLRYSVTGKSIRVEKDLPYVKNYSLDFLNIVRSSTSSTKSSTSIGGSSSGSGDASGGQGTGSGNASSSGGVGSTGSTSGIDLTADSDLWVSLDLSIKDILSYTPEGANSDGEAGAAPSAAGGVSAGKGSSVMNRQAGVLAVNGTQRQHEMVSNFLSLMTRNASAQVLIEAKIVEVALDDQFSSGVDWNRVIGSVDSSYLGLGNYIPASIGAASPDGSRGSALVFGINQPDLGAVVALTQKFGTTRTLSSPRLSAINNQQAVLTFAKNQVYFECKYTPGNTTTPTTGSPTSTQPALDCPQKTVPIGIIMSILPSVNLDTQEVTLNVRPTLTRLLSFETSPVTGFLKSQAATPAAADAIPDIETPVIESREIDSITKVKSGGVMVIGGLMEDVSRNETNSVPGLGEVPFLGNLFKGRAEDSQKRELIIFIKATIVNSDGSSHRVDKKVYEKFVADPRPLYE